MALSDLRIGYQVLTDRGYQAYMGDIHGGSAQPTVIIRTGGNTSVELTGHHLVKTASGGFVHAKDIAVGDRLAAHTVTGVDSGHSFEVSPMTRSGTIVVNGVVLSCYADVLSHTVMNLALAPARLGVAGLQVC